MFRNAVNYYGAYQASKMSFVEIFKDLEKYIDDPIARWQLTVRWKRGVSDTSQLGGFYKD